LSDEQDRIEVHRSGGFAGIGLSGSADIDALPADEARELLALFDQLDVDSPPRAARPSAGGADRFQYDVTVSRGGNRRTLSLEETDLTPAQRDILTRILRRGRPQPA
jgi:hypothetical protein